MAGVEYVCVLCGETHVVATRADGPVYLRCPTTYVWAWHDTGAFEGARPRLARGGRPAGGAPLPRGTAGTGGRAAARSAARPSARAKARPAGGGRPAKGRRTVARASVRKRPRKGARH